MELGNTSVEPVSSAPSASPPHTHSLKSGALSPVETLAQSIALIAPTGAPVMTVPLVYSLAGQGCAIAFLISTIAILLVALNVNQFARISCSPGSLYTYIKGHMHRRFGVLAGWALLIAYIGTAAAVSAGFVNYANSIFTGRFCFHVPAALLTFFVASISCYLAYRDIQVSTRFMLWLEAGSVIVIAVVALTLIVKHGPHFDIGQIALHGVTPEQLRMGLVLAMFSFVGFESATSLGSEARDPLRTIPYAVKWSAVLAGVFFLLCAYAEVLGFHGELQTLDKSAAPLHVIAQKAGLPPIIGTLTDLGAVVSFFSCFLACITAAARLLFQMGREGALHGSLGEAHKHNQTPHRAVLVSSTAAFIPAGIMTALGITVFDIYGLLGTLATFGFVTVYILVSISAFLFLRERKALTPQSVIISALAILTMTLALLGNLYPVPPAPYSVLPYLYAALLCTGFAWSTLRNARFRAVAISAPLVNKPE